MQLFGRSRNKSKARQCYRFFSALSDDEKIKGLNEKLAGVMQRLMLPAILESLTRSSHVCDGDLLTLRGLSDPELGMYCAVQHCLGLLISPAQARNSDFVLCLAWSYILSLEHHWVSYWQCKHLVTRLKHAPALRQWWLLALDLKLAILLALSRCYNAGELNKRTKQVLLQLGCMPVPPQCYEPAASGVHVLVIHETGGLGKTLLASYAYNSVKARPASHGSAEQPFIRCHAEVGLEPSKDHLNKVQQSILEQLTSKKHSITDLQYAQALYTAVDDAAQPVFLFLDNIWDRNNLLEVLPYGTALPPGSAVLITTRRAAEAEMLCGLQCGKNNSEDPLQLCTYQTYQADLLPKEVSQQLFHRLLNQLPTKAGSLTQQQEDDIVHLCDNHPLLLTVMAPILRLDPSKWERVKRDLTGKESVSGVRGPKDWLKRLQVSYDVLEPYLQKAFLDVAHVWCQGLWWKADTCFGQVGDEPEKLQLLVEHSLVSKYLSYMLPTSVILSRMCE